MAKKVKSRWITIPLEVFRRGVMIFIGPAEELIKTLKEKYPEYGEAVERTIDNEEKLKSDLNVGCTFKCSQDAIIWLPEDTNTGTLVHELLPTVFHLLDTVDIKPTPETEEAYCYAIEYLFDQSVEWFEKKK